MINRSFVVDETVARRVAGKNYKSIHAIRAATGTLIEVKKNHGARDRTISIAGTISGVEKATEAINKIIGTPAAGISGTLSSTCPKVII